MKMFRTTLVASVLITNAISVTTVRADHDARYAFVADHAEEIVCAARDLNDELRHRFHDSRMYGELLSTNARIRSKANYLRAQARPSRNGTTFHRFLAELDEQICRMDALIGEARVRAARGIDRPLGSTRAAEAYVAQMRDAVHCIERELSIRSLPRYALPHEAFAPAYPGDEGHERGTGSGRGYGSGYGGGFGPSYGLRRTTWSDSGSGRGISLDRDGITLNTGGLSVHFNR